MNRHRNLPAVTCLALITVVLSTAAHGQVSFFQPPAYAGGGYGSLFVGDFNSDGKPDILAADGTLNLGNGDGTFKLGTPVSGTPLAVADFNGDGKLDILEQGTGTLLVLLGNADGTFQPPISTPSGASLAPIGAVDLNGDGKARYSERASAAGLHFRRGFGITDVANDKRRSNCEIQPGLCAYGILHWNVEPELQHYTGRNSAANLQFIELFGAAQREWRRIGSGSRGNGRASNHGRRASRLPDTNTAAGVDVDVAYFRMAVCAAPKTATKARCAADYADTSILGGMRRRQFVVPHHTRNTKRDVYRNDHSNVRHSEPQHAVDRGRSVNSSEAPINSLNG